MDVSEGEEVSGIVRHVESGEILRFPPGRFRWSSQALVTVDDWGIRCHPDTVFEVPAGWGDGDMGMVLKTVNRRSVADNFLLENLTFDSPGRAAPHLRLGVRNNAHVDGLHYRMNGPLSDQLQGSGITAFVANPSGLLRIDDYRQFNNGDLGGYGGGDARIGIYAGRRNNGTIHLANPVLQGFPNNACYVSRQPGTVIVEGGLLVNNNVSAVRVSGNVEVRNTTVVIDLDRYLDGPGVLEGSAHNTRGLWGDSRASGTGGGLVAGVSVILRSYRRCSALATILENPLMTIQDSQFLLDSDVLAILADHGEIAVTDSEFAGAATGATAGLGDVTGSGNHIAENIEAGDLPVADGPPDFDWARTHRETPGR